jgi:hypothetical protein
MGLPGTGLLPRRISGAQTPSDIEPQTYSLILQVIKMPSAVCACRVCRSQNLTTARESKCFLAIWNDSRISVSPALALVRQVLAEYCIISTNITSLIHDELSFPSFDWTHWKYILRNQTRRPHSVWWHPLSLSRFFFLSSLRSPYSAPRQQKEQDNVSHETKNMSTIG